MKTRPGQGGVSTVTDSVNAPFGGAAWLDDGSLVYVGPAAHELSRVSASGGPRTRLLLDSAMAGFGIGNLAALPDGRGVLFTLCSSGCVSTQIHVLDLGTGREHLLLGDAVSASYLPTGHLLYVRRDGAAMAAPFDLHDLKITGPAVQVLENVRLATGGAFLAWSRSGVLTYMQGSGGIEFEIVRVSRAGASTVIDSTWHGGFNSLSQSPDGRRLAVGVGLANGALGIWIKQLDRGPFSRLTFSGQDRRPAWSPDGGQVAFIRDSLSGSSVYARVTDGSAPERRLVRLDRPVQEVTWSPDGRWLVLRTDDAARGAGDIVGVRTSGDTTPVPLLASGFTEMHPAVSPDGRWLAYTSNESGANEVYVRPFRRQRRPLAGVQRRRTRTALVAGWAGAVLPGRHETRRGAGPRVIHRLRHRRPPAAVRRVGVQHRHLPHVVRGAAGRTGIHLRPPAGDWAAGGPGGAGAGGELVRGRAGKGGALRRE